MESDKILNKLPKHILPFPLWKKFIRILKGIGFI